MPLQLAKKQSVPIIPCGSCSSLIVSSLGSCLSPSPLKEETASVGSKSVLASELVDVKSAMGYPAMIHNTLGLEGSLTSPGLESQSAYILHSWKSGDNSMKASIG